MMVMRSIAVRFDALAVGLSRAFLSVTLWTSALVIGLGDRTLSLIGIRLGSDPENSPQCLASYSRAKINKQEWGIFLINLRVNS